MFWNQQSCKLFLNFLKENAWYKPKKLYNLYQIMFWDCDVVTLWSNNNSNRTKKVKIASFLKNWVKGN